MIVYQRAQSHVGLQWCALLFFCLPVMFIINYFLHNRPRQDCRGPLVFHPPTPNPQCGESGWSEQRFLVPGGNMKDLLSKCLWRSDGCSNIITAKALQSPAANSTVHGKEASLSLFESPLHCSACADQKNAESICLKHIPKFTYTILHNQKKGIMSQMVCKVCYNFITKPANR